MQQIICDICEKVALERSDSMDDTQTFEGSSIEGYSVTLNIQATHAEGLPLDICANCIKHILAHPV